MIKINNTIVKVYNLCVLFQGYMAHPNAPGRIFLGGTSCSLVPCERDETCSTSVMQTDNLQEEQVAQYTGTPKTACHVHFSD